MDFRKRLERKDVARISRAADFGREMTPVCAYVEDEIHLEVAQ
jgi:hypothetical protein